MKGYILKFLLNKLCIYILLFLYDIVLGVVGKNENFKVVIILHLLSRDILSLIKLRNIP